MSQLLSLTSWQPRIRLPRWVSPHNLGVRSRQWCQDDDNRWLEKANTTIELLFFPFYPATPFFASSVIILLFSYCVCLLRAGSSSTAELFFSANKLAPSLRKVSPVVFLSLCHWFNRSTNKLKKKKKIVVCGLLLEIGQVNDENVAIDCSLVGSVKWVDLSNQIRNRHSFKA